MKISKHQKINLIQTFLKFGISFNKRTNIKFSSSTIRKNINQGSFEKVSKSLGRNWFMKGKIIKGNQKDEIGVGALNHGICLNRTKKKIDTRFVLFIDPDFFVLEKNWIKKN